MQKTDKVEISGDLEAFWRTAPATPAWADLSDPRCVSARSHHDGKSPILSGTSIPELSYCELDDGHSNQGKRRLEQVKYVSLGKGSLKRQQ